MSMDRGGYNASRGKFNGHHRAAPPMAKRNPALPPLKAASDMPEVGTIKFFDRARGFGFISRPSGGDVFLHSRIIQQYGVADWQLDPGTPIRFALMKDAARGPAADAICLVRT